ncbi:hypothetical protein HC248_02158 [Polaromonas vacuolata]|uniref:C4-dicarboxylate TRAP transporter large permease protein DctM n=1 Tax=Polaromonas vacuolata TaxID=37448 RepID=A0A6H2HAQ3_9BURK|nr:hypothetical protein [Polaromonas vacuolata]QJC56847.1 hypothetical protein HC248_02158 [Polaromonas vacuolata]
MSPLWIGILVFAVTLLVLATGLPIAFGLGAVALLFMVGGFKLEVQPYADRTLTVP